MLCDGKRVLREGGGERGGEDAVALGGGGGGARALGAHLSADRARRARAEAQQQGDVCVAGRSKMG